MATIGGVIGIIIDMAIEAYKKREKKIVKIAIMIKIINNF